MLEQENVSCLASSMAATPQPSTGFHLYPANSERLGIKWEVHHSHAHQTQTTTNKGQKISWEERED